MAPQRRAGGGGGRGGGGPSHKRHQAAVSPTQSTQTGIQRFFGNTRTLPTPARAPRPLPGALTPPKAHDVGACETPPEGLEEKFKSEETRLSTDVQRHDKRLRISPSTLIQQSQDDGGDQVVWRMSPTAERLQSETTIRSKLAASSMPSSKNNVELPNVRDILDRASNSFSATPSSRHQTKRSPGLAGKLEQWLSMAEAPQNKQKGTSGADTVGVKKVNQNKALQPTEVCSHGQHLSAEDKENDEAVCFGLEKPDWLPIVSQSQQPTLSSGRRNSILKSQRKKGVTKQKGSGQRRKALLELLDQVENVICISEGSSSLASCSLIQTSCEVVEVNQPSSEAPSKERDMAKSKISVGVKANEATNSAKGTSCRKRTLAKNSKLLTDFDVLEADCSNKPQYVELPMINAETTARLLDNDHISPTECPAAVPDALASIHFLVLEVADECQKDKFPRKVLRLLNEHSGVERILYLLDEWFFTVVRPGDTVNVVGEFNVDGKCTIDRNNNLLIVHPDILISGSKVGSSFSCPRRAVLDERIRSCSVAFAALLGTMMHELFQFGLISNGVNKAALEQEAELIVCRYIDSLYACGGSESEALDKLTDSIPTVLNWISSFLHSSPSSLPKVNFGTRDGQQPVSISKVIDIEEMIYSPKFGLKGMIDASVLVNLASKDQVLPLEFKTGKGTTGQASLEHRAQVILYSLLMSDRYLQDINNGLLYYLYTDETQGVVTQRTDLVGLIMRRNEHASNLLAASLTQQLPPMLQNLHVCQRCWHLDTCSIYHKAQERGTAESSGLGMLFNERIEHLTNSHLEFLKFWDRLVDLEAQDLSASQREIWRLPAKEREAVGRCLSFMKVNLSFEGPCDKEISSSGFLYSFCRDVSQMNQHKLVKTEQHSNRALGLHERPFSSGDHVVLSTEGGHVAVAAGIICDITETSVLIKLSHKLRLPGGDGLSDKDHLLKQVWRIDKDETASFLATMRFNLLQLFLKDNGHEHGRQLIVDLKPPRFDNGGYFSQDPAASYVQSASDINDDQRRAIFKILSARDYALVLGMPGTGKTSTIVHAVKALLKRQASVLITSYTNSAVDNILIKLKLQGIDFVRLGREAAIHPDLKDHVIESLGLSTVQQFEARMAEVHVVAATCLGVTHPLLTNRKFDVCIVDEAGQITLPVCLGPLRFADTFVLVGDHYQLPPLVRNAEAREKGLAVSLFRRLSEAHPHAVAALQCQYRMCAGIMKLCNTLIYGNRLRCGSLEVANAQLKLVDNVSFGPYWLQKVMDPAEAVLFLNTDALIAQDIQGHNAAHNTTEASLVMTAIKGFLDAGLEPKEIGVISPYNYQVQLIRRLLVAENLTTLEVQTIDRFQGRDKDCILVSFVKSGKEGKSSATLLADWHRINVAITRAKKKLILIGSQRRLSSTPVLNLLIEQVEQSGGLVHIPQNVSLLARGLAQCGSSGVSV